MTARADRIAVDVINCARCHGKHDALEFQRRNKPLQIGNLLFPWWSTCPVTDQVINMRIETGVAKP